MHSLLRVYKNIRLEINVQTGPDQNLVDIKSLIISVDAYGKISH